MLMSRAELDSARSDPDVLIIDARSAKEYAKCHIPGAVNLDLFSLHWFDSSQEGIRGFVRHMTKVLSFAGIRGKRVVFYDDISGMLAARGVWTLMYLSHPAAFMLDGGLDGWRRAGLETETTAQRFSPSEFASNQDPNLVIGYEELEQRLDDLVIIDARSPDEYSGRLVRAARGGHIPGAINMDWNLNVAPDGAMKDNGELNKLYNFDPDAEIVTYCHGAYRAANSFIALKRLGYSNVRVYLGSWGEWANMPELPVAES